MEDTNWRLLIGGYWLVATNWRHQVRCYRFETMHRLEATDGRPKMGCNILETTDWRPPVRGQSLEVSRFDILLGPHWAKRIDDQTARGLRLRTKTQG